MQKKASPLKLSELCLETKKWTFFLMTIINLLEGKKRQRQKQRGWKWTCTQARRWKIKEEGLDNKRKPENEYNLSNSITSSQFAFRTWDSKHFMNKFSAFPPSQHCEPITVIMFNVSTQRLSFLFFNKLISSNGKLRPRIFEFYARETRLKF